MIKFLAVGAGGFIGSICRYLIGLLMLWLTRSHWFPFGVFVANMFGCLLIGFLFALFEHLHVMNTTLRLFVFMGFLGGFTTYSSFALDTWQLANQNHVFAAMINVGVQIVLGLFAVWLGMVIAKLMVGEIHA